MFIRKIIKTRGKSLIEPETNTQSSRSRGTTGNLQSPATDRLARPSADAPQPALNPHPAKARPGAPRPAASVARAESPVRGSSGWLQESLNACKTGAAVVTLLNSPTSRNALRNTTTLSLPARVDLSNESSLVTGILRLYAPNLKSLFFDVNGGLGALGAENLSHLAHLEYLDLFGGTVTADDLAHLAQSKSLKKLEMAACEVQDSAIIHLTKMRNLTSLNLTDNDLTLTTLGLPILAKVTQLKELALGGYKFKSKDLAIIATMTHLESLDLQWCKLTGEALSPLTALSRLRELDIRSNELGSSGITHLSSMPAIRKLWCNECGLTPEKIRQAGRISHCVDLSYSKPWVNP